MSEVTFDMPKSKKSKDNYAYTTRGRLRETMALVVALELPEEQRTYVRLTRQNSISELDLATALPNHEDPHLSEAREALAEGRPVFSKLTISLPSGEYGNATVVIRKATQAEDALQLINRGHISLRGHTNITGKCGLGPYSSLLYVDLDDPLSEVINLAEGPAHLRMDASQSRFTNRYTDGHRLINYLRHASAEILRLLKTEATEAVDWLNDIFAVNTVGNNTSGGSGTDETPDGPVEEDEEEDHYDDWDIERYIRVEAIISEEEHGFHISALDSAPDLTGTTWLGRVSYGTLNPLNPRIAPDNRIPQFTMEEMVVAEGADLEFNVEAEDGTICPDRFTINIQDQGFEVSITGLKLLRKAECIVSLLNGGEGE